MNTKNVTIAAVIIGLLVSLSIWLSPRLSSAATKEYEVVIPEQKSDTQRLVEAYERLTDQYLTLVQNQLGRMTSDNRDVIDRLIRIEKKLDDLTAKVEKIEKTAAMPAMPMPDMSKMPGMPDMSKMPGMPDMSGLPGMSDMPRMPDVPAPEIPTPPATKK